MSTRFGWCMDGHHKGCRVSLDGLGCSCPCHVAPTPDTTEGAT